MFKKTLLFATSLSVVLSATPLPPIAHANSISDGSGSPAIYAWQVSSTAGASMSAFEKQRATVMLHKLWDRFGVGGKDAAIDNSTVEAHYALALLREKSLSNVSYIDVQASLKKLEMSRKSPSFSAGTLAKYCLIVMHGTQDRSILAPICRELLTMTDKELNEGAAISQLFTIWGAVWIYQALSEFQEAVSAGGQTQADQPLLDEDETTLANKLKAQVEDYIISCQNETGRIGDSKLGYDNQTTAQALYSLVCGFEAEEALEASSALATLKCKQAAANAYKALAETQLTDGSWSYVASGKKGDVDTTGCVLKALAAYERATGAQTQEAKSTQLRGALFLLSTSNASLDGIDKKCVSANEAMAASSAFAGLSSVLCLAEEVDLGADSSALKLPKPSNVKASSKKKNTIKITWNPNKNDLLAADGYRVKVKKGSKTVASKTVAGGGTKTTTISLSKKKGKSYASKKLKVYMSSFRSQTLSIKPAASRPAGSGAFRLCG